MQLEICTLADMDSLIAVSTTSYLEHYTYLWLDEGANYISQHFNAERFTAEMADPNAVFFLIREGQQAVALIKLNIDSATGHFSAAEALELERIYFIKAASGKGYGKEAISFVVDIAKRRNKKVVWLKAMESSPAVTFYKNRGFNIVAETKLDYPNVKEEFQRMFLMHRVLQNDLEK